MATIKAQIGLEKYQIQIQSPSGNTLVADEPLSLGGQDKGFSPFELLAASLGACTAATLRMYADRKAWPLKTITVDVHLEWDKDNQKTVVHRHLLFKGEIDHTQRSRLLAIANSCPVHKILSHQTEIHTKTEVIP